eukprot:GEMP01117020.1.p1 GENE.GEMP01117020.1~~GEMP01117020.1.p1  ORF type:complete len:144 (+),score=32.64 GEMP01117020.1:168-599(+)
MPLGSLDFRRDSLEDILGEKRPPLSKDPFPRKSAAPVTTTPGPPAPSKLEKDTMDASFDDDMLKELMEQNQKLEQKSAKTTKELPEDKKEIAPEFSMNKSNDSLVNETSKKPPAIPPQPSATVSRANDDVHVNSIISLNSFLW